MTRRLSLEARRAEILQRTRAMIAEQGPDGLSLRGVARWCGMTAPGVLHHFDGLKPLLEAVLEQREAEELAAFVAALPPNATLREWTDTVVAVASLNAQENSRFDALETQALTDPAHPAHDFYRREHERRPYPTTVELAQREYPGNPEAVVETLGVVVDGLRLRWLRMNEVPDYRADWDRIRETVFAGFEQYRIR